MQFGLEDTCNGIPEDAEMHDEDILSPAYSLSGDSDEAGGTLESAHAQSTEMELLLNKLVLIHKLLQLEKEGLQHPRGAWRHFAYRVWHRGAWRVFYRVWDPHRKSPSPQSPQQVPQTEWVTGKKLPRWYRQRESLKLLPLGQTRWQWQLEDYLAT